MTYPGVFSLLILLCLNSVCSAHPGIATRLDRIDALIKQHPKSQSLRLNRASLYTDHGRLERAYMDLQQAALLGEPSEVGFQLGKLHYVSGEYQLALDALEMYLQHHPNHAQALLYSARAARDDARLILANEHFNTYFKVSKMPHPGEYLSAARLRLTLWPDDVARALNLLDQAMRQLGMLPQLQRFATELEVQRTNFSGAIARWETLEKVLGRSPDWMLETARLYKAVGENDAARQMLAELRVSLAKIKPTPANQRLIRELQQLTSELGSS